MDRVIDLKNFHDFNAFYKTYSTYLKDKNIPESETSRNIIKNAFSWFISRLCQGPESVMHSISENDILFIMFFYGLYKNLQTHSQQISEIIRNKTEYNWNLSIDFFRKSISEIEDELYLVVASLSKNPSFSTMSLPQPIIFYIRKQCKGFGLLERSCMEGELSTVKCILGLGVSPNAAALHAAIENGYAEIAECLLDNGAKFYWTNVKGYSALYVATKKGLTRVVRNLLRQKCNPEIKYDDGMTLLHLATLGGYDDMVEVLVEKGFSVDATTNLKETSLHLACKTANDTIAAVLLNKGAKVNVVSTEMKTSLHIAVEKNLLSIVKMILETANPEVETASSNGDTALHIASRHNFIEIAEALLYKGGNGEAINTHGNTPVHLAAFYGHVAMCDLLFGFGFDIGKKNFKGQMPLHLAAINDQIEVAEFLSSFSDVDQKDLEGITPLHIASYRGNKRIVLLLLKRGANVENISKKGYRAVHFAAENGNIETLEALLFHGADFSTAVEGSSGLTPLVIAERAGFQDVVNRLSHSI